jgi:uncharacterized membrane protein YfcA
MVWVCFSLIIIRIKTMKDKWAFVWGSLVGILGGLIGLGGAEFRLPVLVGIFKYRTLNAITINLLISLVTVSFSFLFRGGVIGLNNIIAHWPVVINILSGSLVGSYLGVNYATRVNERTLNRIVVIFLLTISFILIGHDLIFTLGTGKLGSFWSIALGCIAGVGIGIFSSMLGVAGGELIIPTIILVFALDIKLAGSLSLAISIPTILVGLFKYKNQARFKEISSEQSFILMMALGSIVGSFLGSYFLRFASSSFLHKLLGIILLLSAFKLARHKPYIPKK